MDLRRAREKRGVGREAEEEDGCQLQALGSSRHERHIKHSRRVNCPS
jgi:hypothetical protein